MLGELLCEVADLRREVADLRATVRGAARTGAANIFTAAQDISPATAGDVPISLTAPAIGGQETIFSGTISDDTGSFFQIFNTTSSPGSFIPTFRFRQSAALIAGFFLAEATTDSGAQPVMVIDARNASGAAITTRPLLDIRTFGSSRFSLSAAGDMTLPGYIQMTEVTAPAAPAANGGRLFLRDNGAGKTQLCIIFNTGAIQVIATQP